MTQREYPALKNDLGRGEIIISVPGDICIQEGCYYNDVTFSQEFQLSPLNPSLAKSVFKLKLSNRKSTVNLPNGYFLTGFKWTLSHLELGIDSCSLFPLFTFRECYLYIQSQILQVVKCIKNLLH